MKKKVETPHVTCVVAGSTLPLAGISEGGSTWEGTGTLGPWGGAIGFEAAGGSARGALALKQWGG